jgi:hypothetical protein
MAIQQSMRHMFTFRESGNEDGDELGSGLAVNHLVPSQMTFHNIRKLSRKS